MSNNKFMNRYFLIFVLLMLGCSCQGTRPKMTVFQKSKKIDIATTAYTSNEKDHLKYGKKTATGSTLKKGVIATDWSIFPVDTVLKIGDSKYTVKDYGSALVDKSRDGRPIVDIYTETRKEMNQWGVKYFDSVEVVSLGSFEKSANILKDRVKYRHCRSMYQRIVNRHDSST